MIIKKTPSKLFLLMVLGFIVLVESLYIITSVNKKQPTPITPPPTETVFCTADAMLCPDGSYVARVAPNCDFAPCPEIETPKPDTTTWKTYKNEKYGFEFMYPKQWKIEEFLDSYALSIALDPEKVSLKEDRKQGLDRSPGLVGILARNEKNTGFWWERFEQRTIGENKIKAWFEERMTYDDGPNPAWLNKHIITYYLDYLEDKRIELEYVSDHEDKYLMQFNQILSTFKFTD